MDITLPPGLLQDIALTVLKVASIALVAAILLRVVGRAVERVVMARLPTQHVDEHAPTAADVESRKRLTTITSLIVWVFRVLIVGFAAVAVLVVLDLDAVIALILVMIAIVGVVARDVIRDYVGGFLLILENQFAIGDWVRVAGEYGEVEALSLRRTLLRTSGGDLVTVPNGEMRVVTNRTSSWGRINLDIGIEDPAQIDAARAAIDRVGEELAADTQFGASVLEAPRLVAVSDISDRGVRLIVQGKIDARSRFATEAVFRERLLRTLNAAGIEIVTATRMQMIEIASPTRDGREGDVGATTANGRASGTGSSR